MAHPTGKANLYKIPTSKDSPGNVLSTIYSLKRLKMTAIKNLTPHPIHIVDAEGNVLKTIASDGLVRLKAITVDAGFTVEDVKVTKTQFGEPEGLPEYEFGVFYIVSQLVKSALPAREDLLVPAEVVRDSNGNIVGCRSLGI